MQKFPVLSKDQVALIRAEFSTGIILDEMFSYAISKEQRVYNVFDSFEEATTFAKKILSEKNNVEVIIYDSEEKLLSYLKPK